MKVTKMKTFTTNVVLAKLRNEIRLQNLLLKVLILQEVSCIKMFLEGIVVEYFFCNCLYFALVCLFMKAD